VRRLRGFLLRLAGLFGRERAERELAEEIESHLAMHAADNERAGLSPDEARRQAVLGLGAPESVKEQYRDRLRPPLVDALARDARYAVRGLARNPGFAAAALVVLALGIGANTAIFTVVNALLLRPLPFRDPDRLVRVWHTPPQASFPGQKQFAVSAANYLDWQRQQHVFESMSIQRFRVFTLTGQGEPEQLQAQAVSAGHFETLGVQPLLGRSFMAEEDQQGRNNVVILSHGLWQTRFGGDRSIVGRSILLDGAPYTVVGVMDARFRLPGFAKLWTPLAWTDKERAVRGEHSCTVVARLAPGVDLRRAQAEMTTISQRLEQQYPEDDKGWGAVVVPLREDLVSDLRPSLLVLLGAVALVLLIACANVANLVLSRTLARRREIAIRLALGSGTAGVVRRVLAETTLLGLAGGVLGLGVAYGGILLIEGFFGDRLPKSLPVRVDGRVLAFAALVSLVAGLLAGLAPALRLARSNVITALKEGGERGGSDAAGSRVRAALVVAEVALSLMLSVGAGLMIRTLFVLNTVDPGFDARNVLTASLALPEPRYPQKEQQLAFFEGVLARVRALPDVDSAGLVTNLPLVSGNNWPVAVVGRPPVPMSEQPEVQGDVITPGYLRTMRIPLLRGRDFTEADRAGRPAVVLVSESMARWLWPDQDPLGQRVVTAFFPDAEREVVGVVKDVKERGLSEKGTATMYLPLAQLTEPYATIVVRTRTAAPAALGPALVAAVQESDREQPVVDLKPMDAVVAQSTTDQRFTMWLLAAFAGVAVLLAAIGIYGVLAYAVRRRVREIGIRVALGADRAGVVGMVVADALPPTLAGLALGLAGTVAIRQVMASLVFGVTPGDPLTFLAVCALLTAVAVGASALPAWQATRVNPTTTLREE
jgi:putative ABC transport system permease protein